MLLSGVMTQEGSTACHTQAIKGLPYIKQPRKFAKNALIFLVPQATIDEAAEDSKKQQQQQQLLRSFRSNVQKTQGTAKAVGLLKGKLSMLRKKKGA